MFSLNGAWRFADWMRVADGIDNLPDRDSAEHLDLAGNSLR